ncbi:MAG: hypothetical protein J5722_10715 [Oscillospiraceae bacterium]|nr:hypothetical protein [Oscillospiraceae bacterium]
MKRLLALLLSAAMLLPAAALSAYAEPESEPEAVTETETDAPEQMPRSEDEVFAKMRIAAENDRLALWVWDTEKLDTDSGEKPEDLFALVNKTNGYVWWSSPVNARCDSIATPAIRSKLASGIVLTDAQISRRSKTEFASGDPLKTVIVQKPVKDGIQITYNFRKCGIKVPVSYLLREDYLEVRIDTGDITEKHGTDDDEPQLAQALAVLNGFGAAGSTEEGCFVIPDGSGAVIRFHNQKNAADPYCQMIYGTDVTAVPKTKGAVVKGVSLPIYGICKGENALLAVAAEGEGNCQLCADVSGKGQSNTEYSRCYFRFILRSSDQFYLGGDQMQPLDVYETNMLSRSIAVRYYPLTNQDSINADGSEALDYTDIAARYRQYLLEDQHVQIKAEPDDARLHIDLYGGCMKQRNVLGFPVFMKTAVTDYGEMLQIVQDLKDAGADRLQVSLNRWTDAGISGKIDSKAKPSGTLGGSKAFRALTGYLDAENIGWYPSFSNTAFYSGNGYWALTDTAVRVSGAFARIVDYESAYGIPYGKKKTMSLLSPSAFPKLLKKLADSTADAGLPGISIAELSGTLYGDYGKQSCTARDTALQYVTDGLKQIQKNSSVLAEHPNAYVLPQTDVITDLPLCSSGFHIFDGDIPLYQLVLHGVIPYTTESVNGSADPDNTVLRAVAAGSNLRFDLLGAEADVLKDTDFDVFFYANAADWTERAVQYDRFARDVLRQVSDSYIISYREDDSRITTRYANGTETVTDLEEGSVTCGSVTRYLKDYIKEGAAAVS